MGTLSSHYDRIVTLGELHQTLQKIDEWKIKKNSHSVSVILKRKKQILLNLFNFLHWAKNFRNLRTTQNLNTSVTYFHNFLFANKMLLPAYKYFLVGDMGFLFLIDIKIISAMLFKVPAIFVTFIFFFQISDWWSAYGGKQSLYMIRFPSLKLNTSDQNRLKGIHLAWISFFCYNFMPLMLIL